VPVSSAYEALSVLIYPLAAIISLMVLTLIAEQAGLFEFLAFCIARIAGGDGRRLFAYIFFAGTATGTVFTNDAAVLIFTPLVFTLIEQVQEKSWDRASKIPYYFAVLYVANLVGGLVISNPINIIVAGFFEIDFLEYASWMILPAVVSMVATYYGMRIYFGDSIPRTYDDSKLAFNASPERLRFMVLSAIVLSFTLIGFFLEHLLGIPTWLVAFIGAASLLILSWLFGNADPVQILKGVGWDVIIFVVGIFIVVTGLKNAGLTSLLQELITSIAGASVLNLTVVTSFVTSICSAVMNNHPTAYAMALTIEDMALDPDLLDLDKWLTKRLLVFAALIGGDLGPKMLPIGSLAALLWFRMLRDRGVHISYATYIKIGIPVTLGAVLLSVLTLNLEVVLARLFFFVR
jgi:arsenical pump membrane protein